MTFMLGDRPRPPGLVLPGGVDIVDPQGAYRFVAPWPWAGAPVSDGGGSEDARVDVVAPRTDRRTALMTLRSGPFSGGIDNQRSRAIGRRLGQQTGVDVVDVERIGLDGRHAILVIGRDRRSPDTTVLLLAPHDEVTVYGRADLPSDAAAGYLLHVRSMLATWRWAS